MLPRLFSGLLLRKTTHYIPLSYFGKYLLNHEVDHKTNLELSLAIYGTHNCRMLADLFKANLTKLTDHQLSYSLYHIAKYELPLDESFYNSYLPIVKEFVKVMDRESNAPLSNIIATIGLLNVQDDGIWTLFDQKIVGERLYRYFSLQQLTEVALGVSNAKRGSKEMWNAFEGVFIKHRKALELEELEKVKFAFENAKMGSKKLYALLEDQNADITGLEGEQKEQGKIDEHHGKIKFLVG